MQNIASTSKTKTTTQAQLRRRRRSGARASRLVRADITIRAAEMKELIDNIDEWNEFDARLT